MEFSMNMESNVKEIFAQLINFENMPNLLPRQLKKMEIVNKDGNQFFTKETLVFKTIVKNEIIQESKHEIGNNQIKTTIISGPAKNSVINMELEERENGSKIIINIDLKLSLKARILLPIVKKAYSSLLTGVLYKIDTLIMENKSR
tara:strand:- start:743 stop:1180 length:438 start_codon:yes stop_codon:yes gene_type:complete